MVHQFCLLMAHCWCAISIMHQYFLLMVHHQCAISIWYTNGAPPSAPLVYNTMRHQYASQGPYLTMCFGTLMAHCGWMRHQYTWHTNGALFGDAPLVYFGILMAHSVVMRHQYEYQVFFYFSDFCTGYKIYYLTEYRQQHTATADSSNTIEDQSPNTIHHISLRIQKTEQR